MFGFEHSLEAYVPKHKRVHGYFTMPLLAGGQLAGRVDPARKGRRSSRARSRWNVRRRPSRWPRPCGRRPAGWAVTTFRLEQIEPAQHASRLAAALTRAS